MPGGWGQDETQPGRLCDRWQRRRKSGLTSARTATFAPGLPIGRGAIEQHGFKDEAPTQNERISGKGELSRRRTICGDQSEKSETPGFDVQLEVDERICRRGRVLSVLGLISIVEDESGDTAPMFHATAIENADHRPTPCGGCR